MGISQKTHVTHFDMDKYRTAALKKETDNITSFIESDSDNVCRDIQHWPDVVFIGKVIMHLTSYWPIIFRMKVKVNNSLLVAKCATANISCIFRMRISSTNIQKTNFNKGNTKRGLSLRLKIWPSDLDLWPWKSIGFQTLLRTKYVPSFVKIHWRMLNLVFTRMLFDNNLTWWSWSLTLKISRVPDSPKV